MSGLSMNSKRRCTVCRDYFPAGQMLRQGVCGKACLDALVDRSRARQNRKVGAVQNGRMPRRKPSGGALNLDENTRKQVRRRDGQRCRMCGVTSNLQEHHITYRSGGGTDDPSNLITLCSRHHNEGPGSVHADKRRWQPVCRAYIWLRYTEGLNLTLPEVERRVERLTSNL